jgi:hypothetical protein
VEDEHQEPINYLPEYRLLIIGVGVLVLGSLMVTHAITWEAFGFWFPFTMVVLGLLIVSGGGFATLMGILLLFGGCSILLHQTGIVTFPYLKAILGWFFVAIGVLGVSKGSLGVVKKHKQESARHKDETPGGNPPTDITGPAQ